MGSRVLIIDDEAVVRESCVRLLTPEGYETVCASNGEDGLARLAETGADAVLTDLRLPRMDGLQVLRAVREEYPEVEVVILTGHGTVSTAVEAMRLGAFDYIEKPFLPDELIMIVGRALERRDLFRENRRLKSQLRGRYRLENIVGVSETMQSVFGLVASVTPTASTVLVTGKSGTGKELIARAIHHNSPRRKGPFVVVDCASIPESLMEAELFGHVKGAFTGATAARGGLLAEADGGSVFFDEIGNVSLGVQAKLLRFLQDRQVRPVGGRGLRNVDVRLIAATNSDLGRKVREGSFREDLFYRLNVFPIRMPSLADRREDIPLLVHHLVAKHAEPLGKHIRNVSAPAMNLLMHAPWPGNVRQLENAVQRGIILCPGETLGPEDFPDLVDTVAVLDEPPRTSMELKERKRIVRERAVAGLERAFVLSALGRSEGNVSRAAADVGMLRPNFHALMKKHEILSSDRKGQAANSIPGGDGGPVASSTH